MDFLTQVRTSLVEQTLEVTRSDAEDIVEYATRLSRDAPRLFALPNDRRQDSVKALLVEYAELRSRLLRLFANLRVLQTLQALPDPIVRPPGLDEKVLDADLFVETYVFVAHAEALGAEPATMDGFLKKLEDVVKYMHFVEGKLPRQ